jgi:hypothetical protein
MISATAANGALRCPDIICCSSSLQSSADPSLLFSLDRNKDKKPKKKLAGHLCRKESTPPEGHKKLTKKSTQLQPHLPAIQEASRIVFAARQSAAEVA